MVWWRAYIGKRAGADRGVEACPAGRGAEHTVAERVTAAVPWNGCWAPSASKPEMWTRAGARKVAEGKRRPPEGEEWTPEGKRGDAEGERGVSERERRAGEAETRTGLLEKFSCTGTDCWILQLLIYLSMSVSQGNKDFLFMEIVISLPFLFLQDCFGLGEWGCGSGGNDRDVVFSLAKWKFTLTLLDFQHVHACKW